MAKKFFFSLTFLFLLFSFQKNYAQKTQEWVALSNQHTKVLLEDMGKSSPEAVGRLGMEEYDDQIRDLTSGHREREITNLEHAKAYLQAQLGQAIDGPVKQDLQILLKSADDEIEGIHLDEKYLLPYYNIIDQVYGGIRGLLEDRISPERQKAALIRLQKYVGNFPGYRPLTVLAREEMQKEWQNLERLPPFKEEVERNLKTSKDYLDEIDVLFKKYRLVGYEPDFQKLKEQIAKYNDYLRDKVLPKARTDFKSPKAIYEFNLKQYGVDMPMDELRRRALVTFSDLQVQMQGLAIIIAKNNSFPSNDYRDVIRSLKKEQLDSASILPYYKSRINDIEAIIKQEKIVTLPEREMVVRLATKAESAAMPAPFMSPPRLIGNTGEYGEFVLPLSLSGGADGSNLKIDDFTYRAAAWMLIAHEGRPGHELQYTSMIETGVSQARSIFARNSVNVEGWALYAEQLMQPYLPLEGQFVVLWSRMVRAARAILDPGLNLGTINTEEAKHVLRDEVVVSDAMVRSELERYRFRAQGQATSYFNGYLRMMELQGETKILLADKFDALAFHDFVLAQGLLPPSLIKQAVLNDFIPEQLKKVGE